MSLEQASSLAQIISALAVFASLIFVGLQIRQNTDAVRAASSQGDFAQIWWKGVENLEDLHEGEIVRFLSFNSSIFRFFESSRVQWLRGQLDDEHWHTVEQHAIALAMKPGVQSFWELRKHWHCRAFQAWFEALPASDVTPLYTNLAASSAA